MRPTSIIQGARRLPLSGKRANKDFYKGTGQSRTPGGGHKTGAPGVHIVNGKGKYRLLDEKVRVFIGPGSETLETTELLPYVATRNVSSPRPSFFNPFRPGSKEYERLPSFSPNVQPCAPGEPITRKDQTHFSKRYARLSTEQRQALVMDARRKWWDGLQQVYGESPEDGYSGPAEFEERDDEVSRSEPIGSGEEAVVEGSEKGDKKGTTPA